MIAQIGTIKSCGQSKTAHCRMATAAHEQRGGDGVAIAGSSPDDA